MRIGEIVRRKGTSFVWFPGKGGSVAVLVIQTGSVPTPRSSVGQDTVDDFVHSLGSASHLFDWCGCLDLMGATFSQEWWAAHLYRSGGDR